MNDIEFYTVDQVCDILELSNQTVRKLIKNEKLFAIKLGRVYRIPRSSLIELKTNKDKYCDVDFMVNITDTMLPRSLIKNKSYISFRTHKQLMSPL